MLNAGAGVESKMFQYSTMQIIALLFQVPHNACTCRFSICYTFFYFNIFFNSSIRFEISYKSFKFIVSFKFT